jgi:uncharacterized membrane protein YhaH (DUF805 family)
MQQARQVSLFITITLWAIIIGGIMYSHIVYFPPYLSHLPESNKLITGEYGLQEGNFWMLVHPLAILSIIITLLLNWKLQARRKFILITSGIYALVILVTATYFLPSLMAFAKSGNSTTVTASEWYQRGQTWQHLSWIRGSFMLLGFLMLLMALIKDKQRAVNNP